MKRLFFRPEFHGRGLEKALAEAVICNAQKAGYRRMRLDTGAMQHEVQALHRRIGFAPIVPYYDSDAEMANWLVFIEFDLRGSGP